MKDQDKTKEQLINELGELRRRIAELEASEAERKQAEKTLQRSEKRFRSIYAESPIGVELYDASGQLLDANRACLDIFGVSDVAEVKGFRLFEDPNVSEEVKERLLKGDTVRYEAPFDFGKVRELELYKTVKSGIIYLDVLITPLQPKGREPAESYLVQVQDITERKQAEEELKKYRDHLEALVEERTAELERDITERTRAEEALRESEERFRQMAENTRDVFWMRDIKNPELIYITPAYERLWGRLVEDTYPEPTSWMQDVHPEDRERVAAAVEKQTQGEPTENEYRIVWPDGSIRWIRDRVSPIYDEAGEAYRLVGVIEDITKRKQAEEALRQLNATLEARVRERTAELQAQYARLDAILSSTTDGIVVTDREGNITQANPVAQTWLTEILSPEDAERLQEAVRDLAMHVDERPEMVLELTQQDLEVSAAPVVGEGAEEPLAAVVDIHDISPFKTLDRMKTTFINNVAHELRTPVSTIKSYTYLMQRTPPEDEKWGQYLDALVQETDQQVQLTENIMQISRIYTGGLEIEPRPTPLNELTEVVVTSHRTLAQERGVTLEHFPMEPAPVAPADPKQMLSALNHLVGDAIRYTPEGGQVIVSTGRREAEGCVWAVVAVSDTGEVIPAEDLPHVFERFFREEELRSVRVSETGLRLMIVKAIVELHGGRVTMKSEESVGSTFTVWLPLASR